MNRPWIIIALPVILLFSSCPGETPFTELEMAELLTAADRAFEQWEVTYDINTAFDYLEFTDAGSVSYTTSGLTDTSSPVYRLELVNLMTDGGFEAGTIAWTSYGVPAEETIIAGVDPYDIDGDVFYYKFDSVDDYIDFDLDALLSGFVVEGNYILRFDLKSESSTVAFEQRLRESGDREIWSLTISRTLPVYDTLYRVPEHFIEYVDSSFTLNPVENMFTIGRTQEDSPIQTGYIDNLRVGRTNTGASLVFEVPYADSTGSRPDLLSGYYRFSIKVLNDPEVSPHTSGLNRMKGKSVTLSIEPIQDHFSSSPDYAAWEPDTTAGWIEWTEVHIESGSIQVDTPEDSSEAIFSISIVPANTLCGCQEYDVGSILIAEPKLTYSSTGIFN